MLIIFHSSEVLWMGKNSFCICSFFSLLFCIHPDKNVRRPTAIPFQKTSLSIAILRQLSSTFHSKMSLYRRQRFLFLTMQLTILSLYRDKFPTRSSSLCPHLQDALAKLFPLIIGDRLAVLTSKTTHIR